MRFRPSSYKLFKRISMKKISKLILPVILLAFMALTGCDKTKPYDTKVAEPEVHFIGAKNQAYAVVTNPPPAHVITVGTTDVADVDREVEYNVATSAGATVGTDFTLTPANKVIIPAGQATATITVQANYNSYLAGEKDTLTFTLKEPSIKVSGFSDTVRLTLGGPCFEGNIVPSHFLGTYNNTNEIFGTSTYGPYQTTISNVTPLTATTASITVTNIFDFGWNPITFTLDWTNVNDRRVTLVQQSGIGDAGTLNSAYAGQDISVRPFTGQVGTFSWCNGTVQLKMQVGVTGLGWFPDLYTVNLAR
jgi:hypothetical protein